MLFIFVLVIIRLPCIRYKKNRAFGTSVIRKRALWKISINFSNDLNKKRKKLQHDTGTSVVGVCISVVPQRIFLEGDVMKLSKKLIILGVIPTILFTLVSLFYIIPETKRSIYDERDAQIKTNVENAYSIVSYYYALSQSGTLTETQAQAKAMEVLSKMRYGSDGYFWIDDVNCVSVMHGSKPENVGKNRESAKDEKGVLFVKEYVEGAIKSKSEGFYSNFWFSKPGESSATSKRGYVKLFEPWGWVVGTGIYIDDVEKIVQKQIFAIVTVNIALLLVTFIFTYWFSREKVVKPLEAVIEKLDEMANNGGDLTQQIKIESNDEIGKLAIVVNSMLSSIRELIKQIAQTSEQVAASSEQLTASAEQSAHASTQAAESVTEVAQGAEKQLQAVGDTSDVVEEMSNKIQLVVSNAETVAATSTKTAEAASEGNKAVNTAVKQMHTIEQTVSSSAEVVSKLGERSKEIGQIVDTISGIASQTNLLALNAAIEAARAGEQGRGFAVVAEEVRGLAEQSQEAAKRIAEMINEIQEETNKAVTAMNNGTKEVNRGTQVVNTAGKSFEEIEELVELLSKQGMEIHNSTQQMNAGREKIVVAVQQIHEIAKVSSSETQSISAATEEQSASMEEIASSSQALASMAEELQKIVRKFKV